jgi:glycosyltransferase involved in cell wall biosynthesis
LRRAFFEYVTLQRLLKKSGIQVIYTFFGGGVPHPAGVRTIATVAYPIICYPESPYWRYEFTGRRWFNRARNWLRVQRLRKADVILVETEIMRGRVSRTLGTPPEHISLLRPAVSRFAEAVDRAVHEGPVTFAVVSDNSRHRNIWRLPEIARHLHDGGTRNFRIVLTIDERELRTSLRGRIDEEVLRKYFQFLGRVPPTRIMEVYAKADVLVQLSDLESFSNNYIEAWRVGLPMIASDRDFARAICEDSAAYVEPHDPPAAAAVFARLIGDAPLRAHLAAAGRKRLAEMPTLEERCEKIWQVISATARA